MEYFEVSVLGSDAVYQLVVDGVVVRYTDAFGTTVPFVEEPVNYQSRSWVPVLAPWMEAPSA